VRPAAAGDVGAAHRVDPAADLGDREAVSAPRGVGTGTPFDQALAARSKTQTELVGT